MHKDWIEITRTLSEAMGETRRGIPEVGRAFGSLAQAATAQGALDPKTKELIATAISIAIRCDGCVGFHVRDVVKHGGTREELLEAIGVAMYMGGGPSFVYGAQALEAFDQFAQSAKR